MQAICCVYVWCVICPFASKELGGSASSTKLTLSDMRSLSSKIRRDRNEFGSRDNVVFVVRKHVPPTFSFTHCLLSCFTNKFGLFFGFEKLTVAIFIIFINVVLRAAPLVWLVCRLTSVTFLIVFSFLHAITQLLSIRRVCVTVRYDDFRKMPKCIHTQCLLWRVNANKYACVRSIVRCHKNNSSAFSVFDSCWLTKVEVI